MADFNFYLNRQGVRGVQGVKGDDGFSPIITVAQDDADGYKLHIQTATDDFDTSNLRPPITDAGGKYLLWDNATGTMTAGFLDYASTEVVGGVNLATAEDMTEGENTQVVPPVRVVADYIAGKLEENNGTISSTITQSIYGNINAEEGSAISVTKILGDNTNITGIEVGVKVDNNTIKVNEQGQLYADIQVEEVPIATTSTAGIVKPDGTTITVDADGTIHATEYELQAATTSTLGGVKVDGTTIQVSDDGTISAVGGSSGGGDVTAAGDNMFTGMNAFMGDVTFGGNTIVATALQFGIGLGAGQIEYTSSGIFSLSSESQISITGDYGKINIDSIRTSGDDKGIHIVPSSTYTGDVYIGTASMGVLKVSTDSVTYTKSDGSTTIDLLNPTVDLSEINSQISAMQADIAAIEQQIGNIVTRLNEINGEDI